MKIKAMAKINLSLDVIRRREDGYHEVRMIMQTVNLYDELILTELPEEKKIQITCDCSFVPCDEHNLIYKAALLLLEQTNTHKGIRIDLKKKIPVAAGMAGGSSDAAATLVGINALLKLGLSIEELCKLGVKIGADVPYCIVGGTMLSEGIGEILTPVNQLTSGYVVVAKPDISVSTKFVYENLHADQLTLHPDIEGMIRAIENQKLHQVADKMENVLETVTIRHYPKITQIKECLMENGALGAMMSGSGPTVFGIFEDKDTAEEALKKVKTLGFVNQSCVTTLIDKNCIIEV